MSINILLSSTSLFIALSLQTSASNTTAINDGTSTSTAKPANGAYKPNTKICFDDLIGCFSNNSPFTNALGYLPIDPDILNTEFKLYTLNKLDEPDDITYGNKYTLLSSSYDPRFPLKLIIHGFQNSAKKDKDPWVFEMAEAFINREKEKINVITVDWERGAILPYYSNATANTRLVGRQTCLLVKLIRDTFYDKQWSNMKNIHCIGHSLGAHTCGYASKECDRMFDRITAMDPASPNFESQNATVRVDKTDAKFVDVIHTNGDSIFTGSVGMFTAVGHVDFYPNGGKQQPGCPSMTNLIGGFFSSDPSANGKNVSCHHIRSYIYFTESINSPCSFLGYPCAKLEDFSAGKCFDCSKGGCAQMGYYTSLQSRGVKYLATNSRSPFCAYSYTLSVVVNDRANKTAGEIRVTIKTDDTVIVVPVTEKSDNIVANGVYRRVFATNLDISEIETINIQFEKKPKGFFSWTDENSQTLAIDKLIIQAAETEDLFSECNRIIRIEDKKSVDINPNDCEFYK